MAADITSNLEAHWKLDDGSGSTLTDTLGARNLNAAAGVTWVAPGKYGDYCATFNGTTQYGTCATWANIQGQGAMSISCWFKSTSVGGMISWGTAAAGQSCRLLLEASGIVWLRCNTATGNWGTNLNDGRWHHVCVTKALNATMNQVVCYIDGVARSGTFTSGGTTLNFGNANPFYLGYDWSGFSYFNGTLDDARIYTRQLSATDVLGLFELGVYNLEGMTGWWKLDDTSGAAIDSSGNGYNGTYNNTPTLGVDGAYNRSTAVTFASASTEYVGSMSLVNASTNAMTITAWIKPNGNQNAYAGVAFSRGGTVNGLGFDSGGVRKIGYTWNNTFGTYSWTGGPSLTDLTWSHVALVITASAGTVYLNGLFDSVNVSANTAIANPFGTLEIGRDSFGTRTFNGTLDDVRIYPRSLDARDIYALRYWKPVRRHGSMYFVGDMLGIAS